MGSSIATRVVEKCLISPPPNSVPDTAVPLTIFDLPWLNPSPVPYLFFYHSNHPAAPFIETLKSSLSLTLQQFFTLAGKLHISPNKVHINYTNGDTIPFTVVESESDFNQIALSHKRDYSSQIYPLLPQLSGLLAVQVTVFPDHGICIGVMIHHITGDGVSIASFFKSWAWACKTGELTATPFYDRGLIHESPEMFEALYRLYSQQIQSSAPLSWSNGAVLSTFTLRRDHIEKLKKLVIERSEQIHCSTFVVSCAYAWVCHSKALGYASDSTVHLMFPVDCRGRLDPQLPPSYFGNCLTSGLVDESVAVLTGEDGVVAAALGIGKAVEELKGGLTEAGERLWKRLKAIADERLLKVAWSPKLGIYDVDFGWGRPARVELPRSAISLTEARERDGGVEIGLALEEGEMKEFEAKFYGGLTKLSE